MEAGVQILVVLRGVVVVCLLLLFVVCCLLFVVLALIFRPLLTRLFPSCFHLFVNQHKSWVTTIPLCCRRDVVQID